MKSWVYRVESFPGESLGHFLGRFRRANRFSHKILGDELGIEVKWVQGWEVPSRRCTPTELQRLDLSKIVGICPKQIATMLSPEPLHLGTRLCAACYAETPAHQALWQSAKIETCDRHRLQLLSTCPQCKTIRRHCYWRVVSASCQIFKMDYSVLRSQIAK